MTLRWCACGKLVKYPAPETRCEDCFADVQAKYHIQRSGNSRRLNINTTISATREIHDAFNAKDRVARG